MPGIDIVYASCLLNTDKSDIMMMIGDDDGSTCGLIRLYAFELSE